MGSRKKVTIGYQNYVGMDLAFCLGPVDSVTEIFYGERSAWQGNVTQSTTIFIDEPDLWGGKKKEGGLQGTVRIAMGEDTQGQNNYLVDQIGNEVPAYRGVLRLIFEKCYVSSMVRVIRSVAATVKKIPKGWNESESEIQGSGTEGQPGYVPGGSANPAHIIYAAITNEVWGLGLNANSFIEEDSFLLASNVLYNENFGLSMPLTDGVKAKNFITKILDHVGGILYTNLNTGKFELKMIREPTQTEIDNAIVFNESNSTLLEYEVPIPGEIVNQVVIKYRPQGALKDEAITANNIATVNQQKGIISQEYDLTGIDNPTIAGIVANRELDKYSSLLAKVSVKTNRIGASIKPGDIIKFSRNSLNISEMIIRVFSVEYGGINNAEIIINGTQDVYSVNQNSYLLPQETEWVDPLSAPIAVATQKAFEANYWDLNNNLSTGDFDNLQPDSSYFQLAAEEPPGISSPSYDLWIDDGSGYEFDIEGQYTPTASLTNSVNRTQTVFEVNNVDFGVQFIEEGSYAYIEDEIVRIDSVDLVGLTITVARGGLDTIPESHAVGVKILFIEDNDVISDTEYADGQTVSAKTLVRTDLGLLPIGSATESQITFTGRAYRPYPPSNIRVDFQYYPDFINALDEVNMSWGHQDRTQQLAGIEDWYNVGLGSPEAGTTYTIRFYGESDNLIRTETGLTGNTFSYSSSQEKIDSGLTDQDSYLLIGESRQNGNIRIEMESIRDGETSHQTWEHSATRTGYGYNYGNKYGE